MSDPNLQAILAELRDTNKDKRRTAVMKLGMLGGEDAVRALVRTLENEYEDLIVRGRAAMLLGKVGDTTAIDPLIRALDAPGYQTPLYAAESLGRLGDKRAIPALRYLLGNSRDRLHNAVRTALEKLGHDFEQDDDVFFESLANTIPEDTEPQPEL